MLEFAQLADLAIRFVSDNDLADGEVGLDKKYPYPQIHYLPDDPNFCKPYHRGKPKLDCEATLDELKQFKTESEKKLKSLYDLSLKF